MRSLVMFFSAALALAQGPVGKTVFVTLDRAAQAGSTTLAPGEYTIKQISSSSNQNVLEFTSDRGRKLEATVTAIPLLQNTPPSQTKVVLENNGGTNRIAKIWVEGEDYGYEFPSDPFVSTQTISATMQARYDAPTLAADASTAPAPVAQPRTEERASPPSPVAQSPAPAEPPANRNEPLIAQRDPNERPDVQTPAAQQTPAPAAQPDTTLAQADDSDEELPSTDMGWGDMLAAGFAFMAIAASLRLSRSREV